MIRKVLSDSNFRMLLFLFISNCMSQPVMKEKRILHHHSILPSVFTCLLIKQSYHIENSFFSVRLRGRVSKNKSAVNNRNINKVFLCVHPTLSLISFPFIYLLDEPFVVFVVFFSMKLPQTSALNVKFQNPEVRQLEYTQLHSDCFPLTFSMVRTVLKDYCRV